MQIIQFPLYRYLPEKFICSSHFKSLDKKMAPEAERYFLLLFFVPEAYAKIPLKSISVFLLNICFKKDNVAKFFEISLNIYTVLYHAA
jgi:hypothetical protein